MSETVNNNQRIVVIGAGLSGLTAAYRLQQAGFSVLVLEKSPEPGGRVQTVEKEGYLFDTGADALTSGYTEYIQLANELGMKDLLVPTSSEVSVIRDGRFFTFKVGNSLSLATTRLLSWPAKLRLLKGAIALNKDAAKLEIHKMHEHGYLDDPETSAGEFSKRIFGEEVANYLIDPVTKLYNGTSANNCSLLDVYISLVAASDRPMVIKGGQARLPKKLAAGLDVGYRSIVENVSLMDDGKVSIGYCNPDGAHQQIVADGCVVATMYDSTGFIYPEMKKRCKNIGSDIVKMALLKIQLAYGKRTESDAFLVQVPDVEDSELYCFFLDHNKCSDRAPQGCSLITVYTANETTQKYLNYSDDELISWARERVEKYMPELAGYFQFSVVNRWPYMAQSSYPGYYRKAAKDYQEVMVDGRIQVACDVFTKGGQNTAVASGNLAAKKMISSFPAGQVTTQHCLDAHWRLYEL